MAEHESWSSVPEEVHEAVHEEVQEETVRRAVATLRRDVEELPLMDPRLVRARGGARRRRSVALLSAGAAAVVVLAVVVGSLALRPSAEGVGPARNGPAASLTPTATRPATTPGLLLDVRSALPVSAEWLQAFSLTETAVVADLKESEGTILDCPNVTDPARREVQQSVTVESAGLDADQRLFRSTSAAQGDRAAGRLVTQIRACGPPSDTGGAKPSPSRMTVTAVADASWPMVFTAAGTAGTRWLVVAHNGDVTSLLNVGDSTPARWTTAKVRAVADIAQARLVRDGAASRTPSMTPSGSVPTSAGPGQLAPPTGSAALDEEMPVAGTRPLLPAQLFVAASQWSSPGLSAGAATHAVTTDWEGSADLHVCDVDKVQDGTASAGRFGIVAVAEQEKGTFLGKQRVRLAGTAGAAAAEMKRVLDGLLTCSDRLPGIKVTALGGSVVQLVDASSGSEPLVSWVGVSTQRTDGAVTTIAITSSGVRDGLAEVERLLAYAAQK